MQVSFALPVVTVREAEKADADKIEGATWSPDPWGDDVLLLGDTKRVTHVLAFGLTGEESVVPIVDEYIDRFDKQTAVQTAQRYFCALLAESLTATALKGV